MAIYDRAAFAGIFADFRKDQAEDPAGLVIWKGHPYAVTTTAFSQSQTPEWLPESARNIANPDARAFSLSPSLCTEGLPQENDTLTWEGNDYTVARATPSQSGATWRVYAYRTPIEGVSLDDADQEAMFEYVPPVP